MKACFPNNFGRTFWLTNHCYVSFGSARIHMRCRALRIPAGKEVWLHKKKSRANDLSRCQIQCERAPSAICSQKWNAIDRRRIDGGNLATFLPSQPSNTCSNLNPAKPSETYSWMQVDIECIQWHRKRLQTNSYYTFWISHRQMPRNNVENLRKWAPMCVCQFKNVAHEQRTLRHMCVCCRFSFSRFA